MKKNLSVILAGAVLAGMTGVTASAEENTINVYVTIADDKGQLALAQQEVTVKDLNEDGIFNIDEALTAANGAYGSSATEYGISIDILWGVENGGSYGYYVNNASAMSLGDEIKSGDYINAFCYTDLTTWSDTYCYFDKNNTSENEFSLTLSAAAWDENYNPITVPVEGAVITINGEKTEFVTNAEGKADITIDGAGSYVISAVSDTQTLVPPVCTAYVSETENAVPANPSTGVTVSLAGILTAAGAVIISRKRK